MHALCAHAHFSLFRIATRYLAANRLFLTTASVICNEITGSVCLFGCSRQKIKHEYAEVLECLLGFFSPRILLTLLNQQRK